MTFLFSDGGYIQPITRLPDGDFMEVIWTGGINSSLTGEDRWVIFPVLHKGAASCVGYYTKGQMSEVLARSGFRAVALRQGYRKDGVCGEFWQPIIPGQKNLELGPANIWQAIARNILRKREIREDNNWRKQKTDTHQFEQ